jgi:hypothetical protein
VEVPRRIEEVHAEEVLLEAVAASLGEDLHRDPEVLLATIAFGLEQRLEPRVERLLGRRLLDDRLEDQVAVGEQLERVVEVAESDEARAGDVHEAARPALRARSRPARAGRVAVAFAAGDVEKHDRDTGRGGEGGDAAPHGAGADDAELGDAHVTEGVRVGRPERQL